MVSSFKIKRFYIVIVFHGYFFNKVIISKEIPPRNLKKTTIMAKPIADSAAATVIMHKA